MSWRHYVAIGDSLTAGTGDSFEGIEHLSWADRLAQALAALTPDFAYHNLAVRGKTSTEMRAEQLPRALELKPDLVSILAGGNDLRAGVDFDTFRANLTALVTPLVESGATVFLVAMIDNHAAQPEGLKERLAPLYDGVRALNRIVRDIARDFGLPLVDLERVAALHGIEMISRDGVHANSLGYLKIAAEVAHQLSVQTGVPLTHPALIVPDTTLEKHRVFRAMLDHFEHPGSAAQELVS